MKTFKKSYEAIEVAQSLSKITKHKYYASVLYNSNTDEYRVMTGDLEELHIGFFETIVITYYNGKRI
jgi:hypothetical protein